MNNTFRSDTLILSEAAYINVIRWILLLTIATTNLGEFNRDKIEDPVSSFSWIFWATKSDERDVLS